MQLIISILIDEAERTWDGTQVEEFLDLIDVVNWFVKKFVKNLVATE